MNLKPEKKYRSSRRTRTRQAPAAGALAKRRPATIERLDIPEEDTRAGRLRGRWLGFEAACQIAQDRGSKKLRFDVVHQVSVLEDGGTISPLDIEAGVVELTR